MSSPSCDTPAAPDSLIRHDEAKQYWESVDADVNGMLGGFATVSRTDLLGSRNFLALLGIGRKPGLRIVDSALEGGAGIGRVTEGLLLDVAHEVDVVEPVAKFTARLAGRLGVRSVANVGLEGWVPEPGARYDLVWTQWCAGHLTDAQLVQFLRRCSEALTSGTGLIVIKENLSTGAADVFDEVDNSVTRLDDKFRALFKEAGLNLVRTALQRGFPSTLLPVRMYALKPAGSS